MPIKKGESREAALSKADILKAVKALQKSSSALAEIAEEIGDETVLRFDGKMQIARIIKELTTWTGKVGTASAALDFAGVESGNTRLPASAENTRETTARNGKSVAAKAGRK